jgi:hypothetical protein
MVRLMAYSRGKNARFPLHWGLGGPHSRSWSFVDEKIYCPCRYSNPGSRST